MPDETRSPVVFLMGPTASGKTDLAIELQDALDGDIISVDSAMVYRGMDIGTAKPDAATLARAPHYLIDIRDPAESYSVADFRADADDIVATSIRRDRVPLLVGGTMMYFKAMRDGLAAMPSANQAVRAELEARLAREGGEALHRELNQQDPEAAAVIHPHNRQRLVRALEVLMLTGRPISAFWREGKASALAQRIVPLALCPARRETLHERIERRFRAMLEQGLVDEVRHLRARGDLSPRMPSMRCVGYRQVWEYLEGKTQYNEMMEKGMAATRQLAKRQLTWLRQWSEVHWLDSDDPDSLKRALKIIRAQATFSE